jgi:phospholipid transport system substrate-binding protein
MMSNTAMRLGAACLLLLVTHTAMAAAKATEPQDIVQQTTEQVLQALRVEGEALKKDRQRLYQLINDLIVPHFDFRQMSQWVLGQYWREASDPQKSEVTQQFKLLLVRTYSDALVEFRDESVAFLPIRDRSDTEVTVRSTIHRSAGPAVPITYQMHKVDDVWKVYDVAIEGVSLVINYRSSFAQEIRRNGIDGLIKRLAEKNTTDGG